MNEKVDGVLAVVEATRGDLELEYTTEREWRARFVSGNDADTQTGHGPSPQAAMDSLYATMGRTGYYPRYRTKEEEDGVATVSLECATPPGFHAKDGLFFSRGPDGGVVITRSDPGAVPFRVVLDEATWASVACAVSDQGEAGLRFYQARAFHSQEHIGAWLRMAGDPIRHLLDHVAGGARFDYNPSTRRWKSQLSDE